MTLWCIGVQSVNTVPQGQNVLYTARVRIFSDANRVSASRAKDFLYARDDQGRRFFLIQDSTVIPADVTINPSESVETSLMFLVPANGRNLYLTGDYPVMPWVPLYFGSDTVRSTGARSCAFIEPPRIWLQQSLILKRQHSTPCYF